MKAKFKPTNLNNPSHHLLKPENENNKGVIVSAPMPLSKDFPLFEDFFKAFLGWYRCPFRFS